MRSPTVGDDRGFVTVEAALVFTAITAVVGVVITGVMTLATYLSAVGMARDAARAAALGDGASAQTVVAAADPEAQVTVSGAGSRQGTSGQDNDATDLLTVTVVVPGRLFDISATAVIVNEPD
ncbi:MAG TPA: hypothetical protein H9870_10465 [Candidatus Corynebacterium avicola]|uniref:TadE-like protein n=1 Tax=Candidatus Corynebacterium avicola TaxID=2838527 RepID=A0A9D1UMP8_9CORY|nr:hypothetical protein [Candidatus Corynebacterium avicola]